MYKSIDQTDIDNLAEVFFAENSHGTYKKAIKYSHRAAKDYCLCDHSKRGDCHGDNFPTTPKPGPGKRWFYCAGIAIVLAATTYIFGW